VQDISGLDMRKFKRIDPKTETRGSANAKPDGSVPFATPTELGTGMHAPPKLPETGFLLDWLSGGEAFQRNIQGFSLRFETLI
jgi:hypothetical protein